jgi:hypothetical protein
MKRGLALLLLPLFAHAQELPRYGLAVWDAKGEYVVSKWPGMERFVLGSGPDSLIELQGLDPRHAEFVIAPGEFKVIPAGEVTIEGNRVFVPQRFFPGQEIRLGAYKVKFFVDASDDPAPAEENENKDAPKEEELEIAPVDPVSAGELAADARKEELGAAAYRFCHDPEFGKDGTEGVDFCVLFDETSDDACPEARKHCANWRHAPLMCMPIDNKGSVDPTEGEPVDAREGVCPGVEGGGSGAGGSGSGGKTAKSRIVRNERREPLLNIKLPPVVGYILLTLLIGGALFWFLKSLKDAGWEKDDKLVETSVLTEAERNLQALPEQRSNVLLKLAERALGRGDVMEAAILVHLAMLRFLDDEGLARYHPSKTNGDYVRSIRRHKELAALFKSAANQTERVRFGDGKIDPDLVATNLREAERLLVRGTGELKAERGLGGAAIGLLLALSMTQTGCPGEAVDPAFSSKAPTGMSAFPVLLKQAGMKVVMGRSRSAEITPDVGVVVVRSSSTRRGKWPQDLKIDGLLDRDISLVVIDDLWQSRFFLPVTSSISETKAAVQLAMTEPAENMFCEWRLQGVTLALGDGQVKVPYGRRLVWDRETRTTTAAAVSHPLALHPFLVYEGSATIDGNPAGVGWAGERVEGGSSLSGCIYLFSDRDLFTNASLSREANARFTGAFFASLTRDGRSILILDRIDAHTLSSASSGSENEQDPEKPNPAKSLKQSNMLPFILQAMATLILLYVMIGAAFGRLRDPARVEHKAFIEHVEAIGRQYAKTGVMGLTHSARSLARLVVMRHRDQVRGGPSGGWAAVAQHLAEKHALEEKDVRAALRLGIDGTNELGTPGPEDPSPASEKMLRILSRLLGGSAKAAEQKKDVWRRSEKRK